MNRDPDQTLLFEFSTGEKTNSHQKGKILKSRRAYKGLILGEQ